MNSEKEPEPKKVGLGDLLGAGVRAVVGLANGNPKPVEELKNLGKKTLDDVDAAVNTGASAKPLDVEGEEASDEPPATPAKEVPRDE